MPPSVRPSGIGGQDSEPKGFRPSSRRRARIAGGAVLAAAAIGGNVLVYSSLDERTEVVQVVTDIRAGELVTTDHLRIVAVDVDPTVSVVPATDLATVANQYARVHIASGALLSDVLVQPAPLVAAGAAIVAVELRPTLVPDGLRERSQVELIAVSDDGELRTTGRAVTRPTEVDGVSGVVTMSVEVAADIAARVAAADDIRIVLVEPGTDPAYPEPDGDSSANQSAGG